MKIKKIIGLMAVCEKNNAIGYKGQLPWYYPEDLKFFNETTDSHIMVMGRKTFESLPNNFSFGNRKGIIFSRTLKKENFNHPDCIIVDSLKEFLSLEYIQDIDKNLKIFMIGGGEIAKLFIKENLIDNFILTKIHNLYKGDVFLDISLLQNWSQELLVKEESYSIYKLFNKK